MGITWSNAKTTCSKKGAGWRLPTQREMQLIAKFSLAITALLGEEGRVTSNNWTLMESGNDNAFSSMVAVTQESLEKIVQVSMLVVSGKFLCL